MEMSKHLPGSTTYNGPLRDLRWQLLSGDKTKWFLTARAPHLALGDMT